MGPCPARGIYPDKLNINMGGREPGRMAESAKYPQSSWGRIDHAQPTRLRKVTDRRNQLQFENASLQTRMGNCNHRGARTHDHKVKSLALYRLS